MLCCAHDFLGQHDGVPVIPLACESLDVQLDAAHRLVHLADLTVKRALLLSQSTLYFLHALFLGGPIDKSRQG